MPNHVSNEVIFRGVDAATQEAILAKAVNAEGKIDFEILVPSPINIWPGSVGEKHEKTFPGTHLDWARANWRTKWNAYGEHKIERTDDTLTLVFDTAWSPPYGWLVALFNIFKRDFEHNWLDEGAERAVSGKWHWTEEMFGPEWNEKPADDEMHKHMHMLRWGCESFPDEDAAGTSAE